MYAQCILEGNEYILLDVLVDYHRDNRTISLSDQQIIVWGTPVTHETTAGWQICCQWKDGSTSWEKLLELKKPHQVEIAEFAVPEGIDHEPAFNWWVKHVLKKKDRKIVSIRKWQTRCLKRSHKVGIELYKTVEKALAIDTKNNNADAISKEMENVRVAFKVLPDGKSLPVAHQLVQCHMVFDVKMEDFRCKARLVAGSHMTEAPATIMYASIVSTETVRISLMIAALNDLEVKSGDILNAYVQASVTEKVWTTLGPEFGKDVGKTVVIVRALYGLKSAGAAFRSHLARCMESLGYKSCKAYPNLWFKSEVRPDDGVKYYSIYCVMLMTFYAFITMQTP